MVQTAHLGKGPERTLAKHPTPDSFVGEVSWFQGGSCDVGDVMRHARIRHHHPLITSRYITISTRHAGISMGGRIVGRVDSSIKTPDDILHRLNDGSAPNDLLRHSTLFDALDLLSNSENQRTVFPGSPILILGSCVHMDHGPHAPVLECSMAGIMVGLVPISDHLFRDGRRTLLVRVLPKQSTTAS